MRQAGATSVGLGMPNIPLALVPGHIGTQSNEEIERNILDVTLDRVIETMRQTGIDMQAKSKETSLGGLAVNVVNC